MGEPSRDKSPGLKKKYVQNPKVKGKGKVIPITGLCGPEGG
jgi:hypothetical protein